MAFRCAEHLLTTFYTLPEQPFADVDAGRDFCNVFPQVFGTFAAIVSHTR